MLPCTRGTYTTSPTTAKQHRTMPTSPTAAATYQNVRRRENDVNTLVRPQCVSGAANRADQFRVEAGVDLRPQVRDVRLDGARTDVAVGAPHKIEQLGPSEHALGVAHEGQQEGVLARGQLDALLAALHLTPVEIDRKVGVRHDRR